ncbi:MAG: hypothetical protein AAGJ81_01580 [Verrucomicrobiota bacterium]
MTAKQIRMYRAEWTKALAEIKAKRGPLTKKEADQCRREIHADVGAPESSKEFNNKDVDAVLAVFFAWSLADDLLVQLQLQNQPEIRARYLAEDMLDRIEAVLDSSQRQQEADKIRRGPPREGYILYLLRRLNPKSDIPVIDSAMAGDWQQVIRALVYRHDQVVRAAIPSEGRGKQPAKRVAKSRQEDARRRVPDDPVPVPSGETPW